MTGSVDKVVPAIIKLDKAILTVDIRHKINIPVINLKLFISFFFFYLDKEDIQF